MAAAGADASHKWVNAIPPERAGGNHTVRTSCAERQCTLSSAGVSVVQRDSLCTISKLLCSKKHAENLPMAITRSLMHSFDYCGHTSLENIYGSNTDTLKRYISIFTFETKGGLVPRISCLRPAEAITKKLPLMFFRGSLISSSRAGRFAVSSRGQQFHRLGEQKLSGLDPLFQLVGDFQ